MRPSCGFDSCITNTCPRREMSRKRNSEVRDKDSRKSRVNHRAPELGECRSPPVHSPWLIIAPLACFLSLFNLFTISPHLVLMESQTLTLKSTSGFSCCGPVTKSCPTLCSPMDCSMPSFSVLHHLPELAQTHVESVMPSNHLQPSTSGRLVVKRNSMR